MNGISLPEISPDDTKLLNEYGNLRKKYESVFGEYDPSPRLRLGPYPLVEEIKDISDKLDEYYRQQRIGKRAPELISV
jgi:hypothetical protein